MIEETDQMMEAASSAVKWVITPKIALKPVVAVVHLEEEVMTATGGAIETTMNQETETTESQENLEKQKSQDLQHTDSAVEDIEEALRAVPMFPAAEEPEVVEVE